MPKIKNRTKQALLLRFNSGLEVLLKPEGTHDISETEIRGNADIEKLKKREFIELAPPKGSHPPATRKLDRADAEDPNGDDTAAPNKTSTSKEPKR